MPKGQYVKMYQIAHLNYLSIQIIGLIDILYQYCCCLQRNA